MASETVRTFFPVFHVFFQNPEKNTTFYVFYQLLHTFSRTLSTVARSTARDIQFSYFSFIEQVNMQPVSRQGSS